MNRNWVAMLDEYGVEFLALDRHDDSEMVQVFRSQPGWAVDFENEETVLFTRANTPTPAHSCALAHL